MRRLLDERHSVWTLPYVPEAYADEVLGHWLARTRLFNEYGSWRVLLEHAGFGRKLGASIFDLVDYDERFATLLAGLKTEYASAILERTTLPYWAALAGDQTARVPGVPQLPMPRTKGGVVSALKSLGRLGTGKLLTQRWYCPQCLAMDGDEGRWPYFRRAHQLPTVFYCPEHCIPLLPGCPRCGASAIGSRRDGFALVDPACPCGFDLRTASARPIDIHDFFRRLSAVSQEALRSTLVDWDTQTLRTWLGDQSGSDLGLAVWRNFEWRVPNLSVDARGVRIVVPRANHVLCFSGKFTTAPAIAALLAAMEIPLSAAAHGARRVRVAEPGQPEGSRPRAPAVGKLAVPDARRLLLDGIASGIPVSKQTKVYWFLRLFDERWLRLQQRSRLSGRPPSVEEDRATIRSHCQGATRRLGSKQQSALTRARLRDKVWMQAFWASRRDSLRRSLAAKLSDEHEAKKRTLRKALEELVDRPTEPVRITYGALGKLAGLTYMQVVFEVKSDTNLMRAMRKANESKTRRQLEWAVRTLVAEGSALNTRIVLRKAKLPSTPRTAALIKRLIARSSARRGGDLTREAQRTKRQSDDRVAPRAGWARP